jgi:hypothetical protein
MQVLGENKSAWYTRAGVLLCFVANSAIPLQIPVPLMQVLHLKPSSTLIRVYLCLHGMALLLCLWMPLPLGWRLLLLLPVLLDAHVQQRHLRDCHGLKAIRLSKTGQLESWNPQQGEWQLRTTKGLAWHWPGCIILPVRDNKRWRHCLITRDMLDGSDWQQLLWWIRWTHPRQQHIPPS